MSTDPAKQRHTRSSRIAEIQRSRLGGIDRIVLDMDAEEPIMRYAHIYEGSLGPTLHATDDAHRPDGVYTADAEWKRVGVIDLDTGELVEAQAQEAV
jgi:hypothetical protein